MTKGKPIIMSQPMVMAILENRKTQTRRIIKPQPEVNEHGNLRGEWIDKPLAGLLLHKPQDIVIHCPYGKIGDRLWVRETWQFANWTEDGDPYIMYKSDGKVSIKRHMPDDWADKVSEIFTVLSCPSNYSIDEKASDRRWRSPFYMPRWASRINLEITNIGVERLQDISEEDAIAEGLKAITKDGKTIKYGIPDLDGLPGTDDTGWSWQDWCKNPVDAYKKLWESTSGDGSWDLNPYVWVVSFRRI